VLHAIGNEPATGVTTINIVNDALQWFASQHEWSWRLGGPVTMDFVSGQNFVELPQDFESIESLTYPGAVARQMLTTTIQQIEYLRAQTTEPPGYTYYYAVNDGSIDDDDRGAGLGLKVLELYPSPNVNVTDALSMTYRRSVDQLVLSDDIPQIPYWCDFAFEMACRAFAHVVEDDDATSPAMQQFERMLGDLVKRDGRTQRRYGVMLGGLYPRTQSVDPLYPTTINDPS